MVKASYAYILGSNHSRNSELGRSFPFDMAHQELCILKARATGKLVSMTSEFHDIQVTHPSLFKGYIPSQ